MGIKGYKDEEVVSVYDPTLKAFHEVPIVELEKQMASLGLTKAEIKEKVKALKGGK